MSDSAGMMSMAAFADLLEEANLASLMAQRSVLDGELSEARRDNEQRSEEERRAHAAMEASAPNASTFRRSWSNS